MRSILITTLLMSPALLAKSKLTDNRLSHFEIQPKICIAKEVGDTCAMKVKLHWQTQAPMNMCLRQNQTTLKCWQQQQRVNETIAIKVQSASEFSLFEQGTENTMATRQVKINYQVSQRYRRRLRSEWSIF